MEEGRGTRESPFAAAHRWLSRIFTVSLEMVLPALGGVWLDSQLGTQPWLALVLAASGMVLGFWHLLAMTKGGSK